MPNPPSGKSWLHSQKKIFNTVIDGIKRHGGNEKNNSTFKNRDIDKITHGKDRPFGRKL